jgi:hypothetical protein
MRMKGARKNAQGMITEPGNMALPSVKDTLGQGVELLDLEQAAPDAATQLRLKLSTRRFLCHASKPRYLETAP